MPKTKSCRRSKKGCTRWFVSRYVRTYFVKVCDGKLTPYLKAEKFVIIRFQPFAQTKASPTYLRIIWAFGRELLFRQRYQESKIDFPYVPMVKPVNYQYDSCVQRT